MRWLFVSLVWIFCAVGLIGCAETPPLPPADGGARTHAVRVIDRGWHTAIVVPRPELAATGLLPEAGDFPDAAFIEFGWGDRVYYPAKTTTLGMTLSAAFTATPAVMHVAGHSRAPDEAHPGSEVIRVALTDSGFRGLVRAIAGEFQRPGGGRAVSVSRGLFPDSLFYDAHGTFHLFNTCNTWTARMLRAGGVDLSPVGVVTANDLMTRLRAATG
ncbi:DUF2459 domain-containing protein [Ferruginivarius sediminum]|uniref:DUF2459 domain-containing protein n=1 Tax=Ferruginivarius sediminum TaxID=2661937 RepID=A0A369T665_9PROT|nr:DUF2459 domain-containing protein [Ferruginivarius sediminum]RDD60810.1 DUF2459 domain-containing protein [Ferruginivarius sediminum]